MRTVGKYLRWEIFKRGQYRKPGFELRPDDTVVDVGANIGMFALWTHRQIPHGRLICIEPNPRALECLRKNLGHNGLTGVTVVSAAVGAESGTMELLCHPGWEAMAYSDGVNAPWFFNGSWLGRSARFLLQRFVGRATSATAQRVTVPVLPLPRILMEHNVGMVNLLKVDCEGGEFELFRSLDERDWARIERVVLEYHDFGPGRDHGELLEILRRHGFVAEVEPTLLGKLYALLGVRIGMIWAKRPAAA
jgi:FkbM family methyltransferase